MRPRFDLFRSLYTRIAAKPESSINLNVVRDTGTPCGTVACVFGELCVDPEVQKLGIRFNDYGYPTWPQPGGFQHRSALGHVVDDIGHLSFGVTHEEANWLFSSRQEGDRSQKREAMDRLERLFAEHNEPLFLIEIEEPVRASGYEVVAA